jgi:hypothetical protein
MSFGGDGDGDGYGYGGDMYMGADDGFDGGDGGDYGGSDRASVDLDGTPLHDGGDATRTDQLRPATGSGDGHHTPASRLESIAAAADGEQPKKADGFVRPDGTKRRYAAPPPPKEVDWTRAMDCLAQWAVAEERGLFPRTFRTDGADVFALLPGGVPDDDLVSLKDTRHSTREALEVVRPFAIAVEEDGGPALWRSGAEDELLERGIKLAASFLIEASYRPTDGDAIKSKLFGVRAFHIGFRYFLYVVLAGEFSRAGAPAQHTARTADGRRKKRKPTFDDADGRPVVAYYLTALTRDEAVTNRCV